MDVNGLKLPDAFVRLISQPDLSYQWNPRENAHDASGRPLTTVLPLELYADLETIESNTAVLHQLFREGRFPNLPPAAVPHGSLSGADDTSKIVWFGGTSSGEPFCFDYRHDATKPRVIYWDDGEWLVLADSFTDFMDLFESREENE
jgi:hypothetical protein